MMRLAVTSSSISSADGGGTALVDRVMKYSSVAGNRDYYKPCAGCATLIGDEHQEPSPMPIPAVMQGRLTLPVIGAPMFIVSVPDLVIAQCKAGIVGGFPALNARPKELLEEWIIEIKAALAEFETASGGKAAPFAVNQIVHGSNDRLEHDVDVCVRQRVPIVITSLRPPAQVVRAVHGYGGIVLHDVISIRHAEKALEQGVDGLILVCAGADQDEAVDPLLERLLGMADRDHVVEDDAAVAVHGLDDLGGRPQAGDDDRHALPDADRDVMLEPVVRRMGDLVDRERRRLAAGRRLEGGKR